MAKNGVPGGGRIGQVTGRSQTYNAIVERSTKRDIRTSCFRDTKTDGTPFKGVHRKNGNDHP
jgi:hypothetical protein